MTAILSIDNDLADDARRPRIYAGEIFCLPARPAARAMADFAWELISTAFAGHDPAHAHEELSVEEYVAILGPLKTGFTHHPESKRLLGAFLVEAGCDPDATYFDVPKLRVVAPPSYLTAGLGYNYTPHRDTWYAAPQCQINWWTSIENVTGKSCMAFFPDRWQTVAPNTSSGFDAYEWNRSSRRDAAKYVNEDPRPHPRLEGVEPGSEVRVIGERGMVLAFSAAHLHATVPNEAGVARFSFDFRTVHREDVRANAGPVNVDSAGTGTTLHDFRRVHTHEQLPEDVIALHDKNGAADGVRVFDPSVLQA